MYYVGVCLWVVGMLQCIKTTHRDCIHFHFKQIGNESVLMQLAQYWFRSWPFPMLKYKYIFQVKYTEAI